MEWKMYEKQAKEMRKSVEEEVLRQKTEMESRIMRKEEEMQRRHQQRRVFTHAQQSNSQLEQQNGGFSGSCNNFEGYGEKNPNPFDFRGNNNNGGGNGPNGPNNQQNFGFDFGGNQNQQSGNEGNRGAQRGRSNTETLRTEMQFKVMQQKEEMRRRVHGFRTMPAQQLNNNNPNPNSFVVKSNNNSGGGNGPNGPNNQQNFGFDFGGNQNQQSGNEGNRGAQRGRSNTETLRTEMQFKVMQQKEEMRRRVHGFRTMPAHQLNNNNPNPNPFVVRGNNNNGRGNGPNGPNNQQNFGFDFGGHQNQQSGYEGNRGEQRDRGNAANNNPWERRRRFYDEANGDTQMFLNNLK